MDEKPKIKLYALTVDCKEPYALAQFYVALLGWEIPFYDEDWACVGAPGAAQGAYPGITFQRNPDYPPPVWTEQPGAQQQMAHLDFSVNDLEKDVYKRQGVCGQDCGRCQRAVEADGCGLQRLYQNHGRTARKSRAEDL